MTHPHTPFVTKRASFAIKESLFFIKEGKVTFFCEKSLSCRYSALSLHSKTVGKWPISDSFSRSASTLGSLCLRSGFALPPLWLRFRRRRKAQGNAAAETRHKQEVFDIFAYWFSSSLHLTTVVHWAVQKNRYAKVAFLQSCINSDYFAPYLLALTRLWLGLENKPKSVIRPTFQSISLF